MYLSESLLWLFPILFMLHDFEEILLMQAWIARNKGALRHKFPALAGRMLPHFEGLTTASFALGVAEEFALLCVITGAAAVLQSYALWLGLLVAFTVHLVMHCVQGLLLRGYVPALATSVLCLPVCVDMLRSILPLFSWKVVAGYTALGLLLMVANLALVHRCMVPFGRWLERYSGQSTP